MDELIPEQSITGKMLYLMKDIMILPAMVK